MARQRINPAWIQEMKEGVKAAKDFSDPVPFKPVVSSFNKASTWLVAYISNSGLIAKVENLGAGVKRISIKGTCCPTCGRDNN